MTSEDTAVDRFGWTCPTCRRSYSPAVLVCPACPAPEPGLEPLTGRPRTKPAPDPDPLAPPGTPPEPGLEPPTGRPRTKPAPDPDPLPPSDVSPEAR